MKIHELQFSICGTGESKTWPPNWECWSSSTHRCVHGEHEPPVHAVVSKGVLAEVKRFQNYDILNIRTYYKDAKGNEHHCTANLEWEPPPTVTDVEKVLNAHLDKSASLIGDLEV